MKKLFSKIAGLTLCLTFAIGIFALGFSNTNKSANATDVAASVCDFTLKTSKGSKYGTEWNYGTDYAVFGGANNNGAWGYVAFGSGKASGQSSKLTEAYIKSNVSLSEDIKKAKFTVTADKKTGGTVIVSLDVSTNSSFSNIIDTVSVGTITQGTAATYTINPSSGSSWGTNNYYRLNLNITNTTTSNGTISLSNLSFYYEPSIPVGTLTINSFSSNMFFVGNSGSLSGQYTWTPAQGDSATLTSLSWASSDQSVFSISNESYSAVAPGHFHLTLTAHDSNGMDYEIHSSELYVSSQYSFELNDNVALVDAGGFSLELGGIEKNSSSVYYGTGVSYNNVPNGTFALTVESGSVNGSLSFKHGDNYLSVHNNSNNHLNVNATKDSLTSWYVVQFSSYSVVYNVEYPNRQLWWNNGSTSLRFACYEGKTHNSSNYYGVNFVVLEEIPVRGEISISSPDSNTTVLKQGVTGNLTYDWTPAEGTSTTITSHTWTSTKPEIISISGDTYTAVAPGNAKIHLEATDSTGQQYAVTSSKEIEVIEVVSGSYAKVTTIADGDTVTLVCETLETQILGKTSSLAYVFYNSAPANVLDFTVIESGSYFAFKTSNNRYLSWKSSADLTLSEEISDKSYWSVSFSNGNAILENKELDGEKHRSISFNSDSPKFGCYKDENDKYLSIQLYAPITSYDSTAVAFAQEFLASLECDNGVTQPDTATWNDLMTDAWTNVNETGREQLASAHAVIHENPATDQEYVEAAMARYDYVIAKYGSTMYDDYIGRNPTPLRNVVDIPVGISESPNTLLVVVIFTTVSISSMILLLVIKRKRHY